jgi:predicted nuclease of predicted toxin-antitoxin system
MLPAFADEHVKFAIVVGLRQRGMDVTTAQERNQRQTNDEILLTTATAEGRLMLTNDVDFLRIHGEWLQSGKSHAGIVYWRQEVPIGKAIRAILQHALTTSAADAKNTVKFL